MGYGFKLQMPAAHRTHRGGGKHRHPRANLTRDGAARGLHNDKNRCMACKQPEKLRKLAHIQIPFCRAYGLGWCKIQSQYARALPLTKTHEPNP